MHIIPVLSIYYHVFIRILPFALDYVYILTLLCMFTIIIIVAVESCDKHCVKLLYINGTNKVFISIGTEKKYVYGFIASSHSMGLEAILLAACCVVERNRSIDFPFPDVSRRTAGICLCSD